MLMVNCIVSLFLLITIHIVILLNLSKLVYISLLLKRKTIKTYYSDLGSKPSNTIQSSLLEYGHYVREEEGGKW